MANSELHRLEMVERARREIFERLSGAADDGYRRKLLATAKEFWEESVAALEAYKTGRRD